MNLKKLILLLSIFGCIKNLFAQEKKDIFSDTFEDITSFEQAKTKSKQIFQYLLDSKTIPGVAISVTKKGHTLWEEGFGYADIENKKPVSPTETLFRVASVSKTISAVGLAKMYDQALIDWNCSLYHYVPLFPKKAFDFNLKQLGGHLAGIRGYQGREMFNNKPFSIEEGLSLFSADPLLFAPGTKYSYNSYNWNLISVAMQKASKVPFETYMLENVFIPLQMNRTFPDRGAIQPNQAVPYSKGKNFSKATQVNNFYKLAGGGFLSTSSDIARFGNAILGKQFLPKEIQQEMLVSQCIDTGEDTGYGIGWQSGSDWNNRLRYGHIGNGIGGYAWFFIYPETEMVIVMCFNVTNPSMDSYLQRIIDYLHQGAKFVQLETTSYPAIFVPSTEQKPLPSKEIQTDSVTKAKKFPKKDSILTIIKKATASAKWQKQAVPNVKNTKKISHSKPKKQTSKKWFSFF